MPDLGTAQYARPSVGTPQHAHVPGQAVAHGLQDLWRGFLDGRCLRQDLGDSMLREQALLGELPLGHIDHGTHQFNDVSRIIQDRVLDRLNMSDRSAGQRDPELARGVYSASERRLKAPFHPVSILREDSSGNCFPRRQPLLRIESKDPEALLRNVDILVAGHIESPATCVAQPLRFGKIRLTLPQRRLSPLAFGDMPPDTAVAGEASPRAEHRQP